MYVLLIHGFAACLLSLLGLGDTAVANLITFDELLDSLRNFGYSQTATTVGALDYMTTAGTSGAGSPCTRTCDLLGIVLPNITSQKGRPSYRQQEAAYWSNQQAETQPTCRVQPRSAIDVAASLLLTKFFNCPFAVKSGGHACFAGASNIQGGLTIDLANLNLVQVLQDRTLTLVGAGNRWIDVYRSLEQQQLSVVGGRVASIGVGGLTLGGGISFFSGRYGFACDNVRNYEVVLANAKIVNVNRTSYPDLYFALRGGGNNFGIVTRFDLETFPQGPMWGGASTYPITANASLIAAFDKFANNAPSDPDAALLLNFYYYNSTFASSTAMEYAKPTVNPPIFHELSAIQSVASSTRITNLTNITLEFESSNPYGFRQTYGTVTVKSDIPLTRHILDLFVSAVAAIRDADKILPAITMQPISQNTIAHFAQNGGNALGIEEGDGPLNLIEISISWSSPSDDERIMAAAASFIAGATAAAEARGLGSRFIYQNYAAVGQDVFGGYGLVNQRRLRGISQRYDPEQVFQRLQPGYFKVGGCAVRDGEV